MLHGRRAISAGNDRLGLFLGIVEPYLPVVAGQGVHTVNRGNHSADPRGESPRGVLNARYVGESGFLTHTHTGQGEKKQ